jgi:thermitase
VANAIAQNRLFVAAAGNSSATGADYPGKYPNTITVASSTETDGLSSFSNRGGGIVIAAPGSNIFSTFYNDTYQTLSGTSMATPQVSGALALALSVSDNHALIRQKLCDTAEKILLTYATCGRINVNRLVRAVEGQ